MIDFRYHLVSIVSIFIALAVGIVLGAGPLQGSIGTQLTDQVSQLRQEKDTLRASLNDANSSVTALDDYAAAVAPAALAGRLRDESVVLVVSGNVPGTFAEQVQKALDQSGASVTDVVTLRDDFRDPDATASRLAAAQKAAELVGLIPSDDADTLMADVMARLLVRPSGTAGTALTGSQEALAVLKKASLIDFTNGKPPRANLAVVLGDPITGTTAAVAAQVATLRSFVSTLDNTSSGVVVAGGTPPTVTGADPTTTLVSQVRADKQTAATISTVDHADTVAGAGLVVLVLAEQSTGTAGHYGTSSDAKADVPPVS